jgi:hypothetical protein
MAGYTGAAAFEDMNFIGDGASAVQSWIDTVYHRTPVLDPWITDLGYGGATGCDTADFGYGSSGAAADAIATYPYDGQSGVPVAFYGGESPVPRVPPAGWPSGYPIDVYVQGATVTAHVLTVDGSNAPIAHQWLSPTDTDVMGLLSAEYVMYANTPLAAGTTYHVHVELSRNGSPIVLDWRFTTV